MKKNKDGATLDDYDYDLKSERLAQNIAVEGLKEKLSEKDDTETKHILNIWMQDVAEGTENEAQKLLMFFRAWDLAYGSPRRDGRAFREDAIKCGLSRAVDLHFTALNMKQKVIGAASLDLLRWVMYGHWGCTRQEKQEDDFKKMVRIEAIYDHETGKKIPQTTLARAVPMDRKKVREIQKKDGYRKMVETVKASLKKSKF